MNNADDKFMAYAIVVFSSTALASVIAFVQWGM
jgi:hypothetical protein